MDDNPLRHLVEDGDVILDLDKATPDDAYDLYDLVWTRSQPNPARLGEVAGMLLDDGVLAVIGGRTTGFDKHFREHGMIGDVAVGRGPLEPERDRINAEKRRRKEGIMPNPAQREFSGGVQRQEFHDGSYVLHKLSGNFDGHASAWYDRNGVMLDAEVIRRRGGRAFPVRKDGPIWNELARAGRVHATRSNPRPSARGMDLPRITVAWLAPSGAGGRVGEVNIDQEPGMETARATVEWLRNAGADFWMPRSGPSFRRGEPDDDGNTLVYHLDGFSNEEMRMIDAMTRMKQPRQNPDVPKRDALVSLGAFVATLPEDEELGGEELGWVADKAIELGLATVVKGMFQPSAAALRVHVTNAPMKAGQDALRVLHDGDWTSHEAGQMAVVVKRARKWADNVMRQREANPASRPFRIGEMVMGIMGVDGGHAGRVVRVQGDGRGRNLVTVATDDGREFETYDFNLTRNVPPRGMFPRKNPVGYTPPHDAKVRLIAEVAGVPYSKVRRVAMEGPGEWFTVVGKPGVLYSMGPDGSVHKESLRSRRNPPVSLEDYEP